MRPVSRYLTRAPLVRSVVVHARELEPTDGTTPRCSGSEPTRCAVDSIKREVRRVRDARSSSAASPKSHPR